MTFNPDRARTPDAAVRLAKAIFDRFHDGIKESDPSGRLGYSVCLRVDRGWAIDARVDVAIAKTSAFELADGVVYDIYEHVITVSWSSTSRSVSSAVAAIALYAALAQLAAEVESVLSERPIALAVPSEEKVAARVTKIKAKREKRAKDHVDRKMLP